MKGSDGENYKSLWTEKGYPYRDAGIREAILRIMEVYETDHLATTMNRLYDDIGDYDEIITSVQVFEKTAYRKQIPWLCIDVCYQYFMWMGDTRKADYLAKGLKYWRFIGFNDEVEMKVPDKNEFISVFTGFFNKQ